MGLPLGGVQSNYYSFTMRMRPSYLFSSREIIPTFALHLVFGVKLPI
jgi:hypothetical protein